MDVKIVELKKTILEDNDADADSLRRDLRDSGLCYLNIMSSPGSGKTTTILQTLRQIAGRIRVGVMEADIDSDVDARTIVEAGYPAIQVHTGGMCHLDAQMSRQGLRSLGTEGLDLVILENVGNLVCPAEFDTGAGKNVVILSVPEGDDKPLKYPLMFEKADVVLVNKMDAIPEFDFDLDRCTANIRLRNENALIFPVSARSGEGYESWINWLLGWVGSETGGGKNSRSGQEYLSDIGVRDSRVNIPLKEELSDGPAGKVKVLEVNLSAYAHNDRIAREVREMNHRNGTLMVNIMASPGAGKTTMLLRTIKELKEHYKIGVMEADIEAAVDAWAMRRAGVRTIQIHTGGECAMNAEMTKQALEAFDTADLDILFLENVGNLVCPAEEDTGAALNVALLSVPEGDDKPLKYPLMFEVCDAVLVSKIDTKGRFAFDDEAVRKRILGRNSNSQIFFLSAKTGEGFDEWIRWLRSHFPG